MANRGLAFLVALSLVSVTVAPCAGWENSPQARHDCCTEGSCPGMLGEAHDAGVIPQADADRCCASAEQRHQQDGAQLSASAFVVAPPVQPLDSPHAFIVRVPWFADRHVFSDPIPHAPLHVLFSVFLV